MNKKAVDLLLKEQNNVLKLKKERETKQQEITDFIIKNYYDQSKENSRDLDLKIFKEICDKFLYYDKDNPYKDDDDFLMQIKLVNLNNHRNVPKPVKEYIGNNSQIEKQIIVFFDYNNQVIPGILDKEKYEKLGFIIENNSCLKISKKSFKSILQSLLNNKPFIFNDSEIIKALKNTAIEWEKREHARKVFTEKCDKNNMILYLKICKELIKEYKHNPNVSNDLNYETHLIYIPENEERSIQKKIGKEEYREFKEFKDSMPELTTSIGYTEHNNSYLPFLPHELDDLFTKCHTHHTIYPYIDSDDVGVINISINSKELENLLLNANEIQEKHKRK